MYMLVQWKLSSQNKEIVIRYNEKKKEQERNKVTDPGSHTTIYIYHSHL